MKLRAITLGFLLLLVLACTSCKQVGERPLWLDDAVEEFAGCEEKGIVCVLGRDNAPCLQLSGNYSNWSRMVTTAGRRRWLDVDLHTPDETVPRHRRVAASRFVQLRYRIKAGRGRSAPAFKAVSLDVRRHPFFYFPSIMTLKGSDMAVKTAQYSSSYIHHSYYEIKDEWLYPLIGIIGYSDPHRPGPWISVKGFCINPRIKESSEYGQFNITVPFVSRRDDAADQRAYFTNSTTQPVGVSDVVVATEDRPVTEKNSMLTPDGDAFVCISAGTNTGDYTWMNKYFNGTPLPPCRPSKTESVAINIEAKMYPVKDIKEIPVNIRFAVPAAGYRMPVSYVTERNGRIYKGESLSPLFLQHDSPDIFSPVIDLGSRVRYLDGCRLEGDIPEGARVYISVRSVDPSGTGASKEGTYISMPRTGTGKLKTDDCIGRIRWKADVPDGAEMKVYLRQGDDGLTWGAWKECDNGERLPEIRKYQQYKVTMKRSSGGESPRLYGMGVSVCPLIENVSLVREAFDPSGDNEGRDAGRLQWEVGLNTVSYISLEIIDDKGIVLCRPYNCKLMKPGKRDLTFFGLVDYAPLPQGSYGYRVIATQKGFQQPMAVREGKFRVQYHLGNCRCRVGGDKK